MTTYDPEDQAERRRVLRNPFESDECGFAQSHSSAPFFHS